MLVKIITKTDVSQFESDINIFLEGIQNDEIIDIKISQSEDEHRIHYTALIILK